MLSGANGLWGWPVGQRFCALGQVQLYSNGEAEMTCHSILLYTEVGQKRLRVNERVVAFSAFTSK